MDRTLNMLIRRVISRLMNHGIDAGVNRMTRGSSDATPEQQRQARQTAQRTKQAMRVTRRIGRF